MGVIKQFNIFDATSGELKLQKTVRGTTTFGRGWAMIDKKALRQLIADCDPGTVTVAAWLISKQTYEDYIVAAISGIARATGIHRNTVGKSLKELAERQFLRPIKIDGSLCWLLNPRITACGKESYKRRQRLWNFADDYGKIADSAAPAPELPATEEFALIGAEVVDNDV